MSFFYEHPERVRLYILLALTAGILALGTVFYHTYEGFTLIDSFYFSVVTLATVGYGDIYPVTDIGKLFTAVYIVIGIGILIAFAEVFVKQVINQRIERINHYIARDDEMDGSM